MNLRSIGDTLLNEASSPEVLRDALDFFVQACSELTGIAPDPCFDAWAEDAYLEDGVAINPEAAANCAVDYQRSVVFIRAVHAAIHTLKHRFPDTPLEILYAGCGPFATLLIPILGKFSPGELSIHLLDIHQRSLEGVKCLLAHFGLDAHNVSTIRDDACHYKHPDKLHLIIAETMQKALEQEPQFAVTANLAPQLCSQGIFIPERIEVVLALANLEQELRLLGQSQAADPSTLTKGANRHPIATVCSLSPENACAQLQEARRSTKDAELILEMAKIVIPPITELTSYDAVLFTRISVYEKYFLGDYESQITLPLKCYELLPLTTGASYRVGYQVGNYPKFVFERQDYR